MTEINLLRWHKTEHALEKKQLKTVGMLAVGLIIIFIALHFFLESQNARFRQEFQDLNNHIGQNTSDTGEDEAMGRSKISQQKVSHVFDLLNCLGENQIQVMQMQMEDKAIRLSGWVDSPGILSSALNGCLEKRKIFSLNKMHFSHAEYNMPVHFSFDIV